MEVFALVGRIYECLVWQTPKPSLCTVSYFYALGGGHWDHSLRASEKGPFLQQLGKDAGKHYASEQTDHLLSGSKGEIATVTADFVSVQPGLWYRILCLVQCPAVIILKFLALFEEGAPHFPFVLGPAQ
jgi:hypothetical protein